MHKCVRHLWRLFAARESEMRDFAVNKIHTQKSEFKILLFA